MLGLNRKGSCNGGSFGRRNTKGSLKFNEMRKFGIQGNRGDAHSGVGPQESRAEA